MYTENSLIKGVANDHDLGDCLIDDISSKMLAREDSVASTVLSKLDNGIGSLANIRIFTTNESIESIDHAFLRPGRIDTVIAIESPNEKTRTEIFSNWNSNIVFDIEKIVDATAGSTYAELNMYKIYMVDSYMKNGCIDTEEIINRSKKALNIEQNKQMGFR
jgi:SpoVK/Ycf46/Vps4 family AAA+-type ATPase